MINLTENEEIRALLKAAVDHWGASAQILVLAEECSELSAAATRIVTRKGTRDDLLGEMADVYLMLSQMVYSLGEGSRFDHVVFEKVLKLISRLEEQKAIGVPNTTDIRMAISNISGAMNNIQTFDRIFREFIDRLNENPEADTKNPSPIYRTSEESLKAMKNLIVKTVRSLEGLDENEFLRIIGFQNLCAILSDLAYGHTTMGERRIFSLSELVSTLEEDFELWKVLRDAPGATGDLLSEKWVKNLRIECDEKRMDEDFL